MLPGFETLTEKLNDYEQNILLPIIVKGLRTKIEKQKIITGREIVTKMKLGGYKINGIRLRKIISVIREKNIIPGVVATSKGYFVSNDIETLTAHYKSLRQRAAAINHIADCMKEHLQKQINPKPF